MTLMNLESIDRNTRYYEEDMNRCFNYNDLEDSKAGKLGKLNYERRRQLELNELLGPKPCQRGGDQTTNKD